MKTSFENPKWKLERKNEMKNIGKYNGIPCYECTHGEYVDAYKKDLDNGKQIFIINGVMVRQNVIIGIYDGKHVKDSYDGKVYYHTYDKNDVRYNDIPFQGWDGVLV